MSVILPIKKNFKSKLIALVGAFTTLAINPWFAYDPINLPKMLVLSIGAGFLLGGLFFDSAWRSNLSILLISGFFALFLFISFFANSTDKFQQLWGVWGRSTGLLTYCAFIVILLSAVIESSNDSLSLIRLIFERVGYVITFYTFLQVLDLDPINWSQKLMVATLGNINFMSSFLGLTSISYLSRVYMQRHSVSSKIFYLAIVITNLYLILISQSIQGVGVFFAGLTILMVFYIRGKVNLFVALSVLSASSAIGVMVLLGTAGLGPLSNLRQETVIFRIDYWTAALNMIRANPLHGVGIDSYGDYYRQFRSFEAVTRTGPQRVSNTAHNIFLDISSGAGIVAGLLFLAIIALVLISILSALKRDYRNEDFVVYAGMFFGFIVFCMISINQIGIGVWGFVFAGLLIGNFVKFRFTVTFDKIQSRKLKGTTNPAKTKVAVEGSSVPIRGQKKNLHLTLSCVLSLLLGLLALVPNFQDAKFLSAMRNANLDQAIDLSRKVGIQEFHREALVAALVKAGRGKEGLAVATEIIRRNPNNWQAWVAILLSDEASSEQRANAASQLIRLDPNNEAIKSDIKRILSK